jgi:hypothetical protein
VLADPDGSGSFSSENGHFEAFFVHELKVNNTSIFYVSIILIGTKKQGYQYVNFLSLGSGSDPKNRLDPDPTKW